MIKKLTSVLLTTFYIFSFLFIGQFIIYILTIRYAVTEHLTDADKASLNNLLTTIE